MKAGQHSVDHHAGRRRTKRIEAALFEAAQRHPDRLAVRSRKKACSYADLARRVTRLARRLQSHGLEPGARVAVFMDKTLDAVTALYAVWAAGGVLVPVYEGSKNAQLEHLVQDAGISVVLTDRAKRRRLSPALRERCPCLEVYRELSSADPGDAPPRPPAEPRVDPSDRVAAILYTSGSSGRPKGIAISHENLRAGARIVPGYLGLSARDRILSVLPFSFDYGLNQLLGAVAVGATLVLQRSCFPGDVMQTLVDHEITVLAAVPPLFAQLAEAGLLTAADYPALRLVTSSGGVFPKDLLAGYRAHLPHARIFVMYGLSEAFRSTYLDPAEVDRKPGSIGRAIPECEVWVLNERGEPCAPRETGELVHRGPTVALGYWNDPEATKAVFRPDPFDPDAERPVVYSGDLVWADEEGFLYFVARRGQLIKSMGFRVSPEGVEEELTRSGLVREVVVGGRPDPVSGTALVAHVVPRNEPRGDADPLMAFCRREMPAYMVPQEIVFHTAFPRTPSGKLDRRRVLEGEA